MDRFIAYIILLAFNGPLASAGTLVFRKSGDIWSINTDGSGLSQQTHVGNADLPRLSSGVLVFRSGTQLYRQTLFSSASPVAIPNTNNVYDFDLDPTATRLAIIYLSNSSFDLYTLNIDGSGLRKINSVGMHQISPSYGRDGYIYLDQSDFGDAFSQKLYRVPESGVNNATMLTNYFSQNIAAGGPGNRVAFTYNQSAPTLRVMNADGSGQVDVPNSPSGPISRIAYDYESDVIYYQLYDQIWRINTDGTNRRLLVSGTDANYGLDYGEVGPTCTYSISPMGQVFPSSGGQGIVNVTTTPGCSWSATVDVPWISTSGISGQGSGQLSFVIAGNTNPSPRFATLNISGQPFSITESGFVSAAGTLVFRKGGDIWSMNTDGSSQVQQTFSGNADLARLSNGVLVYRFGGQLYRQALSSGVPATVIPNTSSVYDFDLDPTGTKLAIVYLTTDNFDLYSMNIDGSAQKKINGIGLHQISPSYGRDGYIYLDQSVYGDAYSQKLYRIPESGINNAALLTNYFSQNVAAGGPANRVAFTYNQPAPMLSVMNADGSGQTIVPNSPSGILGRISYDYENDTIYYPIGDQIWRINVDGSNQRILATGVDQNYGVDYGEAFNPKPICAYSISPNGQMFSASGGGANIAVITAPGCGWQASSMLPWASITAGSTGTGSGNVSVSLSANSGIARTGSLSIAGQAFAINQAGTSVSFSVSDSTLNFTSRQGTLPAAQSFTIAAANGQSLPFSISQSPGSDWLSVTPTSGVTPATIQVTVISKLPAFAYAAAITISVPGAQPATRSIAVNAVVEQDAVPPSLAVDTPSLSFTLQQSGGPSSTTVVARNRGSGQLAVSSSTTTSDGGTWLTVSPLNAVTTADSPAPLNVQADPRGLSPGTYTGKVTLTATTQDGATTAVLIPVTAIVYAARQTLVLSQTGMSFIAVSKSGNGLPQQLGILNIGTGQMPWTVSTGSGWLTVDQKSGFTDGGPSSSIPFVKVSVDAAGLSPGAYYGQIHVVAPSAGNPDQFVSVVLNVLPPGSDPGPQVSPTGLIFTAMAGGSAPPQQTLTVSTVGPPSTFYSGFVPLSADGISWLSMSPSTGPVSAQTPATIAVRADPSRLISGFRRGVITYGFQSGAPETVEVLFVLYPDKSTSSPSIVHAQQPSCTPRALTLVSTTLADKFTNLPIGWPVALDVQVADDCGNAVTDGPVSVSFLNGDPPLSMVSLQNGHWSASWTPRNPGSASVTLTFTAQEQTPAGPITGITQIVGSILTNSNVPVINSGGVVSAASHATNRPLAPGSMISISGVRFTDQTEKATGSPLPTIRW